MNSFTRQGTLESVRSWWSDSNPTGPNINLHALAKPLMKRMYHRQALDYIAEHRFTPFSRGDMEIYASYLGFKYVSSATKIAILRELTVRCDYHNDANTVVDFLILYPLDILLELRNANIQGSVCRLLGSLARQCPNRTAAWAASVGKQLTSFLQDESEFVRVEAFGALWRITRNPKGAQALIDAHVLDRLAELVGSSKYNVRSRACDLLRALASQNVTAVLTANACEQLVTLLRDEDFNVIIRVTEALYWITKSPEGMQAAIDANLLDHVTELLELRRLCTSWHLMCRMLAAHNGRLASP
ncbi:armadillo-type protein [Mycena vulgaris]|nr:armadillo-type protein [Mycena vulgaris]